MIIGIPKNINNFITVDSDCAIKLTEIGFIPIYRSLNNDLIFFKRTEEIEKVVESWNLIIK